MVVVVERERQHQCDAAPAQRKIVVQEVEEVKEVEEVEEMEEVEEKHVLLAKRCGH